MKARMVVQPQPSSFDAFMAFASVDGVEGAVHEGAVVAEGDGEAFGELALGAVLEMHGALAVEEGEASSPFDGGREFRDRPHGGVVG